MASGHAMQTLQTIPPARAAQRCAPGALDEFRVDSPGEVAALLRRLCDAGAALTLSAGDGAVLAATLWSMDAERGSVGLGVDADDPALPAMLEGTEIIVAGSLDDVKLQFGVHHWLLVRGARTSVLRCAWPHDLFRLQRRDAYRVRAQPNGAPLARLRHTDNAGMELALRVVDLSGGDCALFLPNDVPALKVGTLLRQVQIELDAQTRLVLDLRLQHVSSLGAQARGVRLGCEFVAADAATQRALQRFIDATQRRAKRLAVG